MPIHVHAVNAHTNSIAEPEAPPSAAPGERVATFVILVIIINQRANRHEAIDIKIIQLDEETEIANINDHPFKLFAEAFGHKFGFAPLI